MGYLARIAIRSDTFYIEAMNILNTDIIKNDQDVFWERSSLLDGLNYRPVLVLTSEFEHGSLEEEQLIGILKSGCRLLEEQYNLVQFKEDTKIAWHQMREQLEPRVVLLFNISPAQLGIAALLRLNEINSFDDCYWVPSLSLGLLAQDKALKGQLWTNGLKPLFVDKVKGEVLVRR